MSYSSLIVLLVLALGAIVVFTWPRYRLRQALARPFPESWRQILRTNLPVYRKLPTELRQQLEQHTKQFLHEKHFTGCNGLEITDEIRVTIAASACLLILNRATEVYPGLKYLLVYPTGFRVSHEELDEDGLATRRQHGLLGESWDNGKVILSWEDVAHGNRDFKDGSNVALHEFAHQLDGEDGVVNGAPALGSASRYHRWAEVLSREYEVLQNAVWEGDETLLDEYDATNPAEFFAVATEHFFEQPRKMMEAHPALFAELRHYYRVNPAEWQ